MAEWIKVYDLSDDEETIRLGQQAALNTEVFGLVPEVALFGSEEWWQAIEDGRIPRYEIHGVISRVFMSGHGDWPEFELEAGGEKSRWTRLAPDAPYRVGHEVRIEYVLQRSKKYWGSREVKQVLRILIRPGELAPTTPPGPAPSAIA
jgi:hypothetical protein